MLNIHFSSSLPVYATSVAVSALRIFRRALNELKSIDRIVCIMIGTNTMISNFYSDVMFDSYRKVGNNKLLSPFILVENFDCLAPDTISVTHAMFSESSDSFFRKHLKLLGRPIWSNFEESNESINFAALKLRTNTEVGRLAALAVRVCIEIEPTSKLANTMAKSYLAFLFHVAFNPLRCFVTYPSEPVLALASRSVVFNNKLKLTINANEKKGMLYLAIRSLWESMVQGTVDKGRVGELVCRLVLLMASDVAVSESQREHAAGRVNFTPHYITGFSLRSFLNALYGNKSFPEIEKGDALLNFTHFIALRRPREGAIKISKEKLLMGLSRTAAFITPNNMAGMDALIPMMYTDNKLGFISLQFKNLKKSSLSNIEEIRKGLHTAYSKCVGDEAVHHLGIYMQIGGPKRLQPILPSLNDENDSSANSTRSAPIISTYGLESFSSLFKSFDNEDDIESLLRECLALSYEPISIYSDVSSSGTGLLEKPYSENNYEQDPGIAFAYSYLDLVVPTKVELG